MAKIGISLLVLSLICVILEVKCATETFGETTPNIALKENIIVKGEVLGVKTVVIDWPMKDNVNTVGLS